MMNAVQEKHLRELMHVFLEENQKLNLSAFRTEASCWIGNNLDSLAFLDVLPTLVTVHSSPSTILDIGTGGGFPLLPLAICLPEMHFTGVDSVQKKVDAVQRMTDALALKNIRLSCGRAEELGREPIHRERYDIVLSRAVAALPTLLEYASPFVKNGRYIVLWKSIDTAQELDESLLARAEFSCHLVKQYPYDLPEGYGTRQLLIFQKTFPLLKKYPREVGVPKKKPIV